MKKLRVLLVTLCAAVLMCGFTVTAHAGGGDGRSEEHTSELQSR